MILASKIWTKLSTCNNKINTLFEKLTEASHSEGDCYWSTLEVLKDYPVNQVIIINYIYLFNYYYN